MILKRVFQLFEQVNNMNKNHLLICHIVNKNSFTIDIQETIGNAALLITRSQASDIMVIDKEKNFIGVLSEGDLIRAVIPNFNELVNSADGTLAKAYDIFLQSGKKIANQSIEKFVIRDAITLSLNDELLKAAVVMVSKQIRRLPVVSKNKFIGTVSRADICQAILG